MKKIWMTGIAVAAALAAFVGLRLFGFYQNETKQALARAEAAQRVFTACVDEIQAKTAKAACNNEWMDYAIARLEGRAAKPPKCGEHDVRLEMLANTDRMTAYLLRDTITMELGFMDREREVEKKHVTEVHARGIEAGHAAEAWHAYATDRKAQTKHLAHHIWNAMIGAKEPTA